MDRCELAWAAGFFDGEGWVGAGRGRRGAVRHQARINQAGDEMPETLSRFRMALGGLGRLGGPQRKPGRRDLYRWEVSSRPDVNALRELLAPWLCPRKRSAFDRTLGPEPTTRIVSTSEAEMVAWAAGLFDGEGCVSLGPHRSHTGHCIVEAAVTQLALDYGLPPELERFRRALGGLGKIYGPYTQRSASGPVFRWKVNRAVEVRQLYDTLGPFLGETKREQARERLSRFEAQPQLPRGNPAWGNRKSQCVNGHEYATTRIRPYVSRGKGIEPRLSHQCLACLREYARRHRERSIAKGGLT